MGWVGAGNDSLPDINSAWLVFAKSVKGLVYDTGLRGLAMDEGQVGFMDFPALLHFPEKGGVFFASGHNKQAAGFAVQAADKGEELFGVVVAQPVDEGEGAVGSGRVDEPAGRFIHHQERGVIELDGGFHDQNFEERFKTSKRGRIKIRIKMRVSEPDVPVRAKLEFPTSRIRIPNGPHLSKSSVPIPRARRAHRARPT